MSPSWETLDVPAGKVQLHVRRQTAPGRPLLLLHGLGASSAVWQAFARRLNPPWQCVAPDLRGHGESEKPASGYEAAEYASDVAALIASLDTQPLPVVGHSLGALATIALAAHHPDRISAAVLLDPPLDESIARSEVDEVYRLRKGPPGELERYLSVAALAPIFRQAADAAFEAYLRAPRGAKWAWELAPRVSVPTLLVQADTAQGGVLGDRAALDYTTKLRNAERVKLDGSAHAVHATHGAATAKLILEFLGRHTS